MCIITKVKRHGLKFYLHKSHTIRALTVGWHVTYLCFCLNIAKKNLINAVYQVCFTKILMPLSPLNEQRHKKPLLPFYDYVGHSPRIELLYEKQKIIQM